MKTFCKGRNLVTRVQTHYSSFPSVMLDIPLMVSHFWSNIRAPLANLVSNYGKMISVVWGSHVGIGIREAGSVSKEDPAKHRALVGRQTC